MSLPACQRRALAVIEGELQAAEPRLTAMLAMFTRLTSAEDTPCNESLGSQPPCPRRRIRLRRGCSGSCAGSRHSRRLRRRQRERRAVRQMAALIPLVLTIAVSAVMLGWSIPVRRACHAAPAAHIWTVVMVRAGACTPPSHPRRVGVPAAPSDKTTYKTRIAAKQRPLNG
jgi:hypothetical protein